MSRELVALTRDLCGCGAQRGISTSRPSISHEIADAESWTLTDCTDWKLIQPYSGVDLFASRLAAQCPAYFSWRPDPCAQATDALVQHIRVFVNPPWALIWASHTVPTGSSCPACPTQPWYSALLEMLVDFPHWIPQHVQVTNNQLLTIPQLAVWPISGKSTEFKSFRRRLALSYSASSSWRTKTNDSLFGKWHSWYLSSLGKGN